MKAKGEYKEQLRDLQVGLVKLQRHLIRNGLKILILFEGRDAAGKDGVIKRIVQHLSPRETRVVALGPPSDRDRHSWYFQRYVSQLPAAQEMVLLNRSWYNRAGVERVMGWCSEAEYEEFMESVLPFERMLVNAGVQVMKYYLERIALHRIGDPKELAATIAFLLSDDASYVTSATLLVDAGFIVNAEL